MYSRSSIFLLVKYLLSLRVPDSKTQAAVENLP